MKLALFLYPLGLPEQLESVPGSNLPISATWFGGPGRDLANAKGLWSRRSMAGQAWVTELHPCVIWATLFSLSGFSVILGLVGRFIVWDGMLSLP